MQTFPCGHRVVCRKCFVKTIQVAVSQRLLPLRCVVCRAKILRLRQSRDGPFPSSVSQYSMMPSPSCGSIAHHHVMPASHSLYSFNSGSSGLSGVSNVSSASSESGGDSLNRNLLRTTKVYRQPGGPRPQIIKKVKVTSKSGARSKENFHGELPQIRIDNYEVIPIRLASPSTRTPRVLLRENKVAPQEITCRLPTIKEYAEFISERESEREKSSSTRIRCAQKLVNQIENNNTSNHNYSNNNSSTTNNNSHNIISVNNSLNNINYTISLGGNKSSDISNTKKPASIYLPYTKVVSTVTPSPSRKGSSNSASSTVCNSRASILIKQSQKTLQGTPALGLRVTSSSIKENSKKKSLSSADGGKASGSSIAKGATTGGKQSNSKSSSVSNSSNKGRSRRDSSSGSSSSSSLKNSPSSSSNISVKSTSSSKSGSSSRSSSSYKSATSTKSSTSSFSTSSTVTVKSCRSLIPSFRKESESKLNRRRDPCQIPIIEELEKKSKASKVDSKSKLQKKMFEGKEYQRLR